jgi:hypothetical protein
VGLIDVIYRYLSKLVVDDDVLLQHLLIVGFSAFTKDPLNLGIMAPTSEGKSWAAKHVFSLFPKENVVFLSGASPKALIYQKGRLVDADGKDVEDVLEELKKKALNAKNEDDREKAKNEIRELFANASTLVDLTNVILVFLEPPEASFWEAIKPLLSHDVEESVYLSVQKVNERSRTQKIILKGWPAVVFCSAKNEDAWTIWPELKSRFNIVSPTSSSEKYRHANLVSAKLLGTPKGIRDLFFPPEEQEAAREAVAKIIEKLKTLNGSFWNFFADFLAEELEATKGEMMRHYKFILQYSNVIAAMNAEERGKVMDGPQEVGIVVRWDDVEKALELNEESAGISIPRYKLDFFRKVIVPAYANNIRTESHSGPRTGSLIQVEKQEPLTTRQIIEFAKSVGIAIGPQRLRKVFLDSLEEGGYLISRPDPDDKRQNVYEPIGNGAQKYGELRNLRNFDLRWLERAYNQAQMRYGIQDSCKQIVTDIEAFARVIFPIREIEERIPPGTGSTQYTSPKFRIPSEPDLIPNQPNRAQKYGDSVISRNFGEISSKEAQPPGPQGNIVKIAISEASGQTYAFPKQSDQADALPKKEEQSDKASASSEPRPRDTWVRSVCEKCGCIFYSPNDLESHFEAKHKGGEGR